MSYSNFKPLVWSKYIQHELPKITAFEQDCDYRFDSEAGEGKKVKILGVTRPTIGTYTGASIGSPEELPDSSVFLDISQAKYFYFAVDDVDKAQSIDGLMQAYMTEATQGMAEQRDSYIASLCASEAGSVSDSLQIDSAADAKDAFDDALQTLWENGASTKSKITAYLSPVFYRYLLESLVSAKTANDKLVSDGIIDMSTGVKIKMSNNLYNDGTDDYAIMKTSKAVAFCAGLDKVEAVRPSDGFKDAVKGLNVYGGAAVRPKELCAIKVHA